MSDVRNQIRTRVLSEKLESSVIELDDGTKIEGNGDDIDRSQLYLSWSDAAEKFAQVTHGLKNEREMKEIVNTVKALDALDSITPLTRLMKAGAKAPALG